MNYEKKTEPGLFDAVRGFISGHNSFLLLTHVGPDGDGLLACVALSQFLRARKKKATIAVEGSYPSFVAPYDPEGLVRTLEELSAHEDWAGHFDAVFVVGGAFNHCPGDRVQRLQLLDFAFLVNTKLHKLACAGQYAALE